MSLVGSLEDLGLGDILQIISLSRKSGVLSLRSELGEGQIVFRDGRVVGAFCKGGAADLRSLLVADGAVTERDFAAASRAARDAGEDVTQQLHALGILPRARLDELRQRHVERSAFTMFSWPTGEFSFDVCDAADGFDAALCVEPGLDVQYLAMEGARLRDEESRDEPRGDRLDPANFADLGEELRGERGERAPPAAADEPAFEGVAEPFGEDDDDVLELDALAEPLDGDADADTVVLEAPDAIAVDADAEAGFGFGADEEIAAPAAPEIARPPARALPAEPAASSGRSALPVVVVDPDLVVLEWVKASLRDGFERVHIFQKTELAIARIRQYLVRRTTPLVVISERAPADPVTGAANPVEIVRRLKSQAPRMTVLWLGAEGTGGAADGGVQRPPDSDLHDPRRGARLKQLGEALARDLSARARGPAPAAAAAPAAAQQPRAKGRLVQASAELREAVSRGQIIPVVMRFAAEHFSRVALFLVRDELAVGMAQHGLPSAGGPDDAALRDLAIPAAEPAWFRRVFEQRSSVRGPIGDPGDRALVGLLGTAEPIEAYVAPLETGDRVVALLYADNLPANGPLPDTEALEVILHEAGLALDRAALERQLAEFEGE